MTNDYDLRADLDAFLQRLNAAIDRMHAPKHMVIEGHRVTWAFMVPVEPAWREAGTDRFLRWRDGGWALWHNRGETGEQYRPVYEGSVCTFGGRVLDVKPNGDALVQGDDGAMALVPVSALRGEG